jgi:hypothetical protein
MTLEIQVLAEDRHKCGVVNWVNEIPTLTQLFMNN